MLLRLRKLAFPPLLFVEYPRIVVDKKDKRVSLSFGFSIPTFWSNGFVLTLSLLCATPDAECQTQSQEVRMTVEELAKRLMDVIKIEMSDSI